MNYIIQLTCRNKSNPYKLQFNQQVWISDVFGTEHRFTKDKKNAYKFISKVRVDNIIRNINKNNIFHATMIKV